MRSFAIQLLNDRSGATAIEYGLIAAFVGVVLVISLKSLGSALTNIFADAANTLNSAG